MRRIILISLPVVAAACGSPSGPQGPSMNVTVRDETGAPVNRTPVRVFLSASRLDAATNRHGTVEIQLLGAGTYEVRVVPREGYLAGIEPLSKTVSVEPAGTVSVEFTVHRSGSSPADPPSWLYPPGT